MDKGTPSQCQHVPIRSFALILGSIIVAEIGIMLGFRWLPRLPGWLVSIVDGLVLGVLVFPVIYYWSFRALISELTVRKRLERELQEERDQLEVRIQERTIQLSQANHALQGQIEERQQAEAALRRSNRNLRALSECNQALVGASDEASLLDQTCTIIVEVGGYRLAWAGFAEPDEAKSIRRVAQAGFDASDQDSPPLTWDETEWGRGPSGTAIRTGQPCILKDVLNDPRYVPWRERALAWGYAARISLPLMDSGKPFGVLAIYSANPAAFDEEEVRLLTELANDLAFGVTVLRTRASRDKAEEKICQQAEWLDKSQDAICVCDLEWRLRYWNKGAERLYGWREEEMLEGQAERFFAEPDIAKLASIHRQVLTTGEWNDQLHQVTKAGQKRIVQSHWTLIRDSAGQPKSILIINTDLTAQKQIEAQFLRAQRMESLGTLAGGIAHDLNNVLVPVLMAAPLLRRKLPDPECQKLLAMVESSAQRGADIIKQLLVFGRGVEFDQMPLNPRHLIKDIAGIVQETFPKNLRLVSNAPRDVWPISANPTQLHQVLLNLCVNARDAMPQGGTLTLSMENIWLDENYARMTVGAQAGPYVVLKVGDTGTGIPPDLLDKIFEPFFTTKEVGQGTGLGLSTVLGIVKSHGGFVEVHSRVGQGTEFGVYLQASPSEKTVNDAPTLASVRRGHGEWILVVDDEPCVRETVQKTLEAGGYRVLTANDGTEAVERYVAQQKDIHGVVTDLAMPVMDGLALTRALKKLDPTVKVIVSTGLGEESKVSELKSLGVEMFLKKPYAAELLLEALHQTLSKDASAIHWSADL